MARPTKPKDLKPKATESHEAAPGRGEPQAAGGGGQPSLDLKFIVTILAIFLASIAGSIGATYFLSPIVLSPIIAEQIAKAQAGHGGEHKPADQIGMTLELDEFTVNLKTDPTLSGNQFLRTKMSLSIAVPPEENCNGEHANALPPGRHNQQLAGLPPGVVIAGAAAPLTTAPSDNRIDRQMLAEGGSPQEACNKTFNEHMAKYVPTMRDIINAALMKRSAGTLATLEGQEALKDEIKEQINQLMGTKYSVIRVNFSDFIIQY